MKKYTLWELTGDEKGIKIVGSYDKVCERKLPENYCQALNRILYNCPPMTLKQWRSKLSMMRKQLSQKRFHGLKSKLLQTCGIKADDSR